MTYGFAHYEISVALNLDVDDLLVGLIAEIKQSLKSDLFDFSDGIKVCLKTIFQKIQGKNICILKFRNLFTIKSKKKKGREWKKSYAL